MVKIQHIVTGEMVDAHVESVSISQSDARGMQIEGWRFDWSYPANPAQTVLALKTFGGIQGLIGFTRHPEDYYTFIHLLESAPANIGHKKKYRFVPGVLLGTVAQDAFEAGFDGYMTLKPKTKLYDLYIDTYGAEMFVNGMVRFTASQSAHLIHKYIGGNYNE
ncbi:GNAT family N-acetyltransferase [Periweissella cryptocerci]|uniref:GNAT family N-acetyltransferase n=1 Tax=Periweissella cryptocerci TaxID=2506420 RepID=A0A4P6YQS1_9LACO|nr:GNAT family N-acetyltransferase [Periweissella cryptocerci]QBO34948.1 GNAT family N-acetyltransferase [Periweissella cryptocerci]